MRKLIDILYGRPFILLLLFLLLAYLPVFLPFFHLKNDLVGQNLPTRFVIAESLYSGYFPWWNPYINFGIPQYGDMNNGFWNPFLWLIAKVFGYNIWTITYEEMFYILIGGWGIYVLCRELAVQKGIALLAAISYMTCGYVVGHLQYFCWITGTAFFPYLFSFLLKINKNPILKNYIVGAFVVFLFVASTHPGLIIGAAYFFLFTLITIFIFRKNYTSKFYHSKFLLINLSFLILGMIFSVAVISSDIDVLRYISRGSKLSLDESLLAPTTFQCYLSLLFPLAVNKSSFFGTDISMRNVFIGLACLPGFILLYRYVNKKILVTAFCILIFFIFLAAGGIFKTIFYYSLPLVGNVRLNGEFAYFVLFIAITGGSLGLHYFVADARFKVLLRRLLKTFMILSVVGVVVAILLTLLSTRAAIAPASGMKDVKASVKTFVDHLGFAHVLLISALVQLVTFFLIRLNSASLRGVAVVVALNLIMNTWLVLPFTGLGMKSKQQIHEEMVRSPRGLFPQQLQPLDKTTFMDTILKSEFTLLGSYSKKMGYPDEEQYPVELRRTQAFFNDSSLHTFITHQSYIFLSTDTIVNAKTNFDSSFIKIDRSGAGYLQVTVDNKNYRFIIFLQNDYPYWQTFINGHLVKHYTVFKTFIAIPIQPGRQEVKFVFNPYNIRRALFVNAVIIVLGLITLLVPGLRNKSLFK